jgi:hypothetical protein
MSNSRPNGFIRLVPADKLVVVFVNNVDLPDRPDQRDDVIKLFSPSSHKVGQE